MQPVTLAPARSSANSLNPNSGKSRPRTLGTRTLRTSAPRGELRSSVTILHVDPASLKRARRAGRNTPDATLDRATVVARSVTTTAALRAASESVRAMNGRPAARVKRPLTCDELLNLAARAEQNGHATLAATLLNRAMLAA
jgi:hypothetical protein